MRMIRNMTNRTIAITIKIPKLIPALKIPPINSHELTNMDMNNIVNA